MRVRWSRAASDDLVRLHAFLRPKNPRAAEDAVSTLTNGVMMLDEHPGLGVPLEGFTGRDVRRLFVGDYEIRYELRSTEVFIVRLWHAREDR
ncbi:MAG: type II toxin-antitoxin system RelE/ParE family toxin [Rhodospirillaceae bacterium]|nr:type II toxin-antitoxin system RelE/ParE family toxin [Rhodospirillaceae bacterium]